MDAISQDGRRAVSVIAFIGSVFSPWYAWSGRRDPENHICLNVATYGPGGRFCMTDRGRAALRLARDQIRIGPSRMVWTGDGLVIEIDEAGAPPLFGRLKGRITLRPEVVTAVEMPLAADGGHVWRPFAPVAQVRVDLGAGGTWDGHGYLDGNFGTRALEADFDYWTWGRFPTRDGAICFYDAERRDGSRLSSAVRFGRDGTVTEMPPPPGVRLPRGLWGMRRETRGDAGVIPARKLAMLDTPFYTRTALQTRIDGEDTVGVHEALDLRRFRAPVLKPMLALRVPRRRGWRFED